MRQIIPTIVFIIKGNIICGVLSYRIYNIIDAIIKLRNIDNCTHIAAAQHPYYILLLYNLFTKEHSSFEEHSLSIRFIKRY